MKRREPRKTFLPLAVAGLLLLFLLEAACEKAFAQSPRSTTCTVNKVYDGDGIGCVAKIGRTTKQWNLRFVGIDAPEVKGHQPDWQDSRDTLRALVLGKAVTIELRGYETVWKRHLVRVLVDGKDAGLEQVKAGYAWYRPVYALSLDDQQRGDYQSGMDAAKTAKSGLWAGNPVPPWQWRRGKR